jgi:hypothetical protein
MRKVPRIFWPTVMLFLFLSAGSIGSGFFFPDLRPGYGVTLQGWLSNYFAPLRGTPLDTPVFYLDSGKPGATALVIGGTQKNKKLIMKGLPDYPEMVKKGVGAFLN